MRQTIFRIVKRQAFAPGALGLLLNPFYIIRRGLHRAVKGIAPRITGRVLDFGCGSKPYEREFTHASDYVGIDIAVSGHRHYDSKVDVYYDGHTIPFDADTFDAVVAFEVFEHVFNLDEILAEIRRVIKPGGKLFFTVPFIWDEHEAPYDFGRYTSFGIRFVLERNGFTNVEVNKTTTYYEAVSQLRIAYVFQHMLPRHPILKRMGQLIVIPPMTIASVLMNHIMPKSYDCYCNLAVLCQVSPEPLSVRPDALPG